MSRGNDEVEIAIILESTQLLHDIRPIYKKHRFVIINMYHFISLFSTGHNYDRKEFSL